MAAERDARRRTPRAPTCVLTAGCRQDHHEEGRDCDDAWRGDWYTRSRQVSRYRDHRRGSDARQQRAAERRHDDQERAGDLREEELTPRVFTKRGVTA